LPLLLKCFPRVERIVCDKKTPSLEREWIEAAAAGKLKHLMSVRGPDPVFVGGDACLAVLCSSGLLPHLAEIPVPLQVTHGCVTALCQMRSLRAINFYCAMCRPTRDGVELNLRNEHVDALLRHSADTLQTLNFGECSKFSKRCHLAGMACMGEALSQCQALRELSIDGRVRLSPRGLAFICQLPQLHTLTIRHSSTEMLDDAALAPLVRCANLTALDISFYRGPFTDRAFEDTIARIPRLASLRMKEMPWFITGRVCTSLARHASGTLTQLDIGDNQGKLLAADAFDSVARCQALTALDVSWTLAEVEGERVVSALRQLPRLTQLNVTSCDWLTDAVCEKIAALPLLDLSIGWNDDGHLSERGLRAIVRMPRLTALDVSRCGMTDLLFEDLVQHCRSLTALQMRWMCSKELTAAAVAQLSRLPRLRWSRVDVHLDFTDVQGAVAALRRWDAPEKAAPTLAQDSTLLGRSIVV
jgi:hypothetical protein